jgi:hypothetical protein
MYKLRDCVITAILVLNVISSEARNLVFVNTYEFKIPRLMPRNDIMTQPLRGCVTIDR